MKLTYSHKHHLNPNLITMHQQLNIMYRGYIVYTHKVHKLQMIACGRRLFKEYMQIDHHCVCDACTALRLAD